MPRAVWARSVALFSISLLLSALARAEDAPYELLARMNTALRTLDFQGSFVYEHDGRVDALRIFHLGGERERERLVSLTGPRGEIVRNDGSITCMQSGTMPTLFANGANLHLLPLVPNIHALGAQYSTADAGEDRVAGYAARVIDITPTDHYRYGYRLWLEQNSQLLLRSAVIDAARRPLEQFMFVALDVGAKPSEADLAPAEPADTTVSPADEVRASLKPHWRIAQPPAGFRLVRAQQPLDVNSTAEHLIYSDGIASVSIYVEPLPSASAVTAESTSTRGVLSVHSRSEGSLRITALGDVPPVTVQTMARGIRASDAH